MSSTNDNPGAFRPSSSPGLRSIARRSLAKLRQRDLRAAAVGAVVDTANWLGEQVTRKPRFRCSCCGFEGYSFRHVLSGGHAVWNSACPKCDSRSRHRGLAILLPQLISSTHPERALHFAAEPVLRRSFAAVPTYETADLFLEDATHTNVDIQHLPFRDGSYDLIVCNHVLEHVPDDSTALAEIARVLSTTGLALITVPGDFRRKETIYFHGNLPNGHFRDYGFDFVTRLKSAFDTIEIVDLHTFDRVDDSLTHAIKPRDLAFVCRSR